PPPSSRSTPTTSPTRSPGWSPATAASPSTNSWSAPATRPGEPGSVGEARQPALQHAAVAGLGVELAEDADRAERDAVDHQVRRGQVELLAELVGLAAGVAEAGRLAAQPGAAEAELVHRDRLQHRYQVVEDLLGVDVHVVGDEALVAQAGQHLVG